MSTSYDVVVIGAGFAGITTARNLVDRGHSVVVLEANDRIGGKTYARPFKGHEHITAELGGSWVNPDMQPGIRSEISRYGIQLREDVAVENAVFYTGGIRRNFPVPADELADLERAVSHLREVSRRISPTIPLSQQPLADLDISVEDFIAPLNLGPVTRELFYAVVAWYTGTDAANASVFGTVAQTAGFGHSPYGFYGALTQRFVGGAGTLLQKMVDGARLDIRLNHHVTAIEQAPGDAKVLVRTRDGADFTARSVVVAVPTNVMRHIDFKPGLSEEKARLLSRNHLGRAYKPSILVRNIPRRPFTFGSGRLQSLCLGYEYDDGSCLVMGFGDENSVKDPVSVDELTEAVHEFYPEAEVIAVDAHDWNNDPLFDGTYRVDRPGEALPFLRAMSEPEDRVVFAGTDVDDSVWRIWIEGAINSGYRASDQVSVILHR